MQCRSHASQLGRLYDKFKAANCEILLILGEPVEKARQYSESLKLPFPVLADPERQVYSRYGLENYFQLMQRTASLIIDQGGIVRYIHVALNPMTWLKESREVVDVVQSLIVQS